MANEPVIRDSLAELSDRLKTGEKAAFIEFSDNIRYFKISLGGRLLSGTFEQLIRFNEFVYKVAVSLSAGPLEAALNNIIALPSWSSARLGEALTQADDLPNFSLAPQEYITKVSGRICQLAQSHFTLL